MGKEVDTKGVGYNINQSIIAIGSGGLKGKGFLEGTQTKGDFVPEQHTDYIFSTVGEEWGFIGSFSLIFLFCFLIIRIILQAEKQTNKFRRVYSYGVAGLIFSHFLINIGMSLGMVPTIGIPLPFISYGGSSILAFSIMVFIHLNLMQIDSTSGRINALNPKYPQTIPFDFIMLIQNMVSKVNI